MKSIFLLIFCFCINFSFAQIDLNVKLIPDSLLKDADAVIRYHKTAFEILEVGKTVTKVNYAVTIFNERAADEHNEIVLYYDKFSKFKDIEAKILNSQGQVLKTLKKADITDYGLSGEFMTDNRAKLVSLDKKAYSYPYTLVLSYEEESAKTLFYPAWNPIEYENTSIISSSFEVRSPAGISYRKKEVCLSGVKYSHEKGIYERWEIANIKPKKFESFSENEQYPELILGPDFYKMDDYKGPAKTWDDIASFYTLVNAGRDKLPDLTKSKLREYVGNETDKRKIIEKTYSFMQSHTRYFLIALGIGGWQALTVEEVANKGYGDCKALTNYTIALLKEMGIIAYPALIYGNKYSINMNKIADFPVSKFNHVIACVPLASDTLWLECTSQTDPAGYQGSFTSSRKALLINGKKGFLVNTKSYKPEENLQERNAHVTFNENGDADIQFNSTYTGIQHDLRSTYLEGKSKEELKKFLSENLDLPNSELIKFDLKLDKKIIPKINENLSINASRYYSKSGNRIFFKPSLGASFDIKGKTEDTRETGLYLNNSTLNFKDIDNYTFNIPLGFKIEYVPKNLSLSNSFGSFNVNYALKENQIIYSRILTVKGGQYSKSEVEKWYTFLKEIRKSDNQKAVLIAAK